MRTRVVVVVGVLILAAAGTALWLARPDDRGGAAAQPTRFAGLATKTVRAGSVEVAIRPLQVDQAGAAFAVTLTTQSSP